MIIIRMCSALNWCACDLYCWIWSPKKVLQSVKKCVFRMALVHPMVYFNVIDIERYLLVKFLSWSSITSILFLFLTLFICWIKWGWASQYASFLFSFVTFNEWFWDWGLYLSAEAECWWWFPQAFWLHNWLLWQFCC